MPSGACHLWFLSGRRRARRHHTVGIGRILLINGSADLKHLGYTGLNSDSQLFFSQAKDNVLLGSRDIATLVPVHITPSNILNPVSSDQGNVVQSDLSFPVTLCTLLVKIFFPEDLLSYLFGKDMKFPLPGNFPSETTSSALDPIFHPFNKHTEDGLLPKSFLGHDVMRTRMSPRMSGTETYL